MYWAIRVSGDVAELYSCKQRPKIRLRFIDLVFSTKGGPIKCRLRQVRTPDKGRICSFPAYSLEIPRWQRIGSVVKLGNALGKVIYESFGR